MMIIHLFLREREEIRGSERHTPMKRNCFYRS